MSETHRYTKEEAIELMKTGVKMRHRHFSDYEWMYMEGNTVILEDGVKCPSHEFWRWRPEKSWLTGWAKFEEWIK